MKKVQIPKPLPFPVYFSLFVHINDECNPSAQLQNKTSKNRMHAKKIYKNYLYGDELKHDSSYAFLLDHT